MSPEVRRDVGSAARVAAQAMASAAQAWIASLTEGQRAVAVHAGPGPEGDIERTRWFYVPTDHGGLPLNEQTPRQQQAALRLVATGLSEAGFVALSMIMGLENVLDRIENFTIDWGRERGRDPGLYYLTIFGRPGDDTWGWRFGGHHLSLNNLVLAGRLLAVTPQFFGADPASSPLPGNALLRPLGPVQDRALGLVRSLDQGQRAEAVLFERALPDMVGGNRVRISDGDQMMTVPDLFRLPIANPDVLERARRLNQTMEDEAAYGPDEHRRLALTDVPKGLSAKRFDREQRGRLRSLLASYFERAPDFIRDDHLAFYAQDAALEGLFFAWAGPTGEGDPQYYRIQGPELLIEFDNTQRRANHVHSVWRDPKTDFGLDALAVHHEHFHRHSI